MPHSWPGLTRKEKGKLNKGDAGSSLKSVQMFPRSAGFESQGPRLCELFI